MKRLVAALVTAGLIIIGAGPGADGSEGSGGYAFALRPLVVSAKSFMPLLKTPRERLALLALTPDGAKPAPFQIDSRDADGEYILGPPERPLKGVTLPGPLAATDELVLMASDLAACADPPAELEKPVEISAVDPGTGARACAYLGQWNKGDPPRAIADYVDYELKPGFEKLITPHFIQVYGRGELFISDLMVKPAAGGNGNDVFDKLKMRSTVTAIGGFSLTYNETDFRSELTGVRDGPVRVVRRTETALILLLGVGTPSVRVNAFFYRDSYEVPSTLRFPFRADLVLNNIDYYQGCDLLRASGPYTYYADIMEDDEGVTVDGVMSPREQQLAHNRADHKWGLFTGAAGTIFYFGSWTDPGTPVHLGLFYEDDASRPDPPENEPGDSMYGFRLVNALDMSDRAYELNIAAYVVPGFDGRVRAVAKGLTSPFEVKVNKL